MPAYKDKKRKTWYANFYYTDWTGKKIHKCKRGFPTQREAKEWERNFIEQQSKDCTMLFKNFAEIYCKDMENRLRPRTYKNQQFVINNKILPYFGDTRLCDIDTVMVRKWQNKLMQYTDNNGAPYKPTYLKTIHTKLSAMLNYAVSHYNLKMNPCRAAGSIGKRNADEMRIWTPTQYNQFIQHENKPAGKLAFDVLYYTGIRTTELLGLLPKDIFPDMRMSINKNYAKVDGVRMFTDTKTPKSKRIIALPEFLYNDLQTYMSKLYGLEENDRIFYFEEHWLQIEIKRVSKLANMEPIRVHDLRHSHASLLIEMGFDVLEISRRLGHDSAKTTLDTYGHLFPNKDVKMAAKLDQLRKNPAILEN